MREEEDDIEEKAVEVFKFPATCVDHCKYPTELDRLENLVDVSDGFLLNAFEDFFFEKPQNDKKKSKMSLFEK